MSKITPTRDTLAPDEMLPPVQPPSATFLVQLFVIPALIVLVMVLVWMLINWLPQMGNDAEANVKALQGSGANRWQAAVNLANLLRGDTTGALKRDPELAAKLAGKLNEEVAAGQTSEETMRLRVYLATALGEFYVDTGLPALVTAATTKDATIGQQSAVRVAAVRSIAVLSNNLRRETDRPIADAETVAAVVAASHDDDPLLRTAAAFALGELGGSAARERLRTLLDDVGHPYARYNAATALARRGEAAVIDVIIEMLATEAPPETSDKDSPDERNAQRIKLVLNGLRAATDLADVNAEVDLSRVVAAVEKIKDDESRDIRNEARVVLDQLKRRGDV